jgi:hypothetical protein
MFFAVNARIPNLIARAISGVDHLIVSLDRYHEREVPRHAIFSVLCDLVENGKDVSFHIVGSGEDDPYIDEVTANIRTTFKDRVPAIVADVQPVGRAADWMPIAPRTWANREPEPTPCSLAAWPVVTFDGTVVLCCNQQVVDGPPPAHLRVGHIATESWEEIRNRHQSSGMQRALRIFGPEYLAHRFGSPDQRCDGYCQSCWRLADEPNTIARIEEFGSRPTLSIVAAHIATVLGNIPLQGLIPKYAHLASLGAPIKSEGDNLCE